MEIERKYLIPELPDNLDTYPFAEIEQAYICTDPVVRIRRQDSQYILTCKGSGMLAREECNLPMTEEAYHSLLRKAEGTIIKKRRYRIPAENGLLIELDLFDGVWKGVIMAEVEFPDTETAGKFTPPAWFGEEVTFDPHYHNSWLSSHTRRDLLGDQA